MSEEPPRFRVVILDPPRPTGMGMIHGSFRRNLSGLPMRARFSLWVGRRLGLTVYFMRMGDTSEQVVGWYRSHR